ncbi:MAG TPA: alpha/beta hydrolase [Candidatus Binatia bacterium]|jgi:pimeloyl-ACP methyl ester carboxylesterase
MLSQLGTDGSSLTERTVTLVLLPGLDGTEVFFAPLLAALPAWVKPVVVTYPTSGANRYADLLDLVRAALNEEKDFYVLGWSFSGPLALMLAAQQRNKVRGVILCASFVRPPLPGLAWLRCVVTAPVVYLIRLARRAPLILSRCSTAAYRRDKAATWIRVPSRTLATRARAIVTVDARNCLRGCPRPVLYLAGSRDKVIPRRNVDEVMRELPSTKVVTVDGPHLALYTNPGASVRAIVQFINETETG